MSLEIRLYICSIEIRDNNQFKNPVLLDANESPFGEYHRYPDSTHKKIREKIARRKAALFVAER